MGYALGVDLGTTFSAAATAVEGRVEIFQLGERTATIPSVLFVRPDGEVLTGEAAERRALMDPTRTAREFKRRLGDPTPFLLGGTPYGAEALLGHLLRAIVTRVAQQMGTAPETLALTHPASYGPYKRDLLRQAGHMADVGEMSLISEPEAAAIDYASQERVPPGAVIAVYDFGGGTFDVTIMRKAVEGFSQLGEPIGLERLGGIDFDEAILAHVDAALGGILGQLDARDPPSIAGAARLREECRRAKEALSADTDATVAVLFPTIQSEVRITREEFEAMIRPRIADTIGGLRRALRGAGISMDEVDRILLVGGTSRIPLIAEMVGEATKRRIAVDAHPKHAVALGAARMAARTVAIPDGPSRADGSDPVTVMAKPATASRGASSSPPAGKSRQASTADAADRTRQQPLLRVAGVGFLIAVLAISAGAWALLGGTSENTPPPTAPLNANVSPAPTAATAAPIATFEGSVPIGSVGTSLSPTPSAASGNRTPRPTRTLRPTPRPTRTLRPTPPPLVVPPRADCSRAGGSPTHVQTLSTEAPELTVPDGVIWCIESIEVVPGNGDGIIEVDDYNGMIMFVDANEVCCDPYVVTLGHPRLLRAGQKVVRLTSCDPECDNRVRIGYEVVRSP